MSQTIDNSRSTDKLLEISSRLGKAHALIRERSEPLLQHTPRSELTRFGKSRLYFYPGHGEKATHTPLLIVYALVNRPYMLDLEPGRSFIGALVEQGLPVYLIDWDYPDITDQFIGLEDYVFDFLDCAVEKVRQHAGSTAVNLLGVCQGGTFSICYTATMGSKVKNLVTMVTPVDFHTNDNLLSLWFRDIDIDKLVAATGNVPGQFLNWVFLSLKPFQLGASKYINMLDQAEDPEALETFLRMERWIADSPDQAGRAFSQFVKGLFQENALVNNTLCIDNRNIDLARITQPVLNIFATHDHLVPPSASRPLGDRIASEDYTAEEVEAGHIGVFTSTRHCRRTAHTVVQWLKKRD